MPSNRELFLRHLAPTSPAPMGIEVAHAQGVYVVDVEGKRYIDMISGIATSSLGHGHPAIASALKEQAKAHTHVMVYGEFVQAPQVQFAHALVAQLPPQLNSVYFVNSGSEATEGAIKLAIRATGRTQLATLRNAYHGSTTGALLVMGNDQLREPYLTHTPDVLRIDPNNLAQLDQITRKTAAVFVEPIQGEAGVRPLSLAFIQAMRKRCDQTGTLMVMDEAQTGFGRTGNLFCCTALGVVPDILLLAKSMGGGLPLGAFVANADLMQLLSHNPALGHITTFGGHPLSCATGLAALQVVLSDGLAERAEQIEALIRQHLIHPDIVEIRGTGALLAVELGSWDKVQRTIAHCLQLGLITDWFLFCDTALRIAPPLIITDAELVEACAIINKALALSQST